MSKFINKVTLLIIVFYIFWLGILPLVLTEGINSVCKNLSRNADFEVTLNNPKVRLSVLPIINFEAKEFQYRHKKNKTDLQIENFKCGLRFLPLFSGKLHFNNIQADSLLLEKNLKKQFDLNVAFFNNIEKSSVVLDSLFLKDFKMIFQDNNVENPIIYEGTNFDYKQKNRFLKLSLNSSLIADKESTNIDINLYLPRNNDIKKTTFDLNVSNLNLAPFKDYFANYFPVEMKEFRGVINARANKDELIADFNNCAFLMNDDAKSIILPHKMNIKSRFNIKRNSITLDYAEVLSDRISATINGKITDYFGKSMPSIEMNIVLNKSKIEDLISMVPAFKIEEIDFYKLKKYKFYGDVLANLSIKGRLPEPDVNGEVFIDNSVLTEPIPGASRGATIKLDFIGRYVNFDVVVPAGKSEKVWVKGGQELYNVKYADFTVKSTKNLDLEIARNVVASLREILNFIVGPLPVMELRGRGNVDLIVKGNRKNPHLWGTLKFMDSTASFNGMPNAKLTNSDSLLTFKDQEINFSNTTGFVNGKDFSVKGVANLNGKFDFSLASKAQPASSLYKAVKTSTLIPRIKDIIPDVDKIAGNMDLDLKVYGDVKSFDELEFDKNFFVKGKVDIINNSYSIQNIDLENTSGKIIFDSNFLDANVKSNIGNSPMTIMLKVKNDFADFMLDIPKLNPNFLIRDEKVCAKQYLPYVYVKTKYKGPVNSIEYDKLTLTSKILASNPKSILKFNSGDIILVNNKLIIKNVKGYFSDPKNVFNIDLKTDEAFSETPIFNGVINVKAPDISLLNDLIFLDILPQSFRNIIKNYELKKGSLDLSCRVFNNHVNAQTDVGGVSLVYVPLDLPIEIINGNLAIRNNVLKLNKINILADEMPVLADGEIRDIFDKQIFNLYFNSKPQQDFIDKYINKNQIYPIKIKGDIVYWTKLKGVKDNYELKSEVDMSKNSSVYYLGAMVGDIENAIELSLDSKILGGNNFKIKEFSYDKIIDSLSGKQTKLNMLKTYGGVEILDNDLNFRDLKIKTTNPTDARIFNIIFRKPNIKQGQFTSDLKLNGKLSNPKVIGDFHIFETDIPFFDTTMKNIELVFKDKVVNFESKGEVLSNDIIFEGVLKNKLTKPYVVESARLYTNNLNLNHLVNRLKTSEVNEASLVDLGDGIQLSSIIAKDFRMKADNIQLRNIHATNFEASTSLNEKGVFDVANFNFNIAQGSLNGKYRYNLKDENQSLSLNLDNIDANDITCALFDLQNQIYGDMTGNVNLSCSGASFQSCMESLNGSGDFSVKEGKMPKLGSLEYLLKAGNLLKGGLTGLSINSVIDIITPLKTGEFEIISGNFRIKDGVARNVEIASRGKDLSLYTQGTYNFATSVADMQVLGLLSKKISTFLGPIGNMSINTLFNVIPGVDLSKDSIVLEKINKIPGVELSSKAYRRFLAEIKGNINGEDYVSSFKWIN